MKLLAFLRSWLADILGHYDYTRHQCEGMKPVRGGFICCRRHRGHYGQHVSFNGEVFK